MKLDGALKEVFPYMRGYARPLPHQLAPVSFLPWSPRKIFWSRGSFGYSGHVTEADSQRQLNIPRRPAMGEPAPDALNANWCAIKPLFFYNLFMHPFHRIALALFLACLIGYALAGFPTEGQALDMVQTFDNINK